MAHPPSTASWARLRCEDTGSEVRVPESALGDAPRAVSELRRRLRHGDVQSAWAGPEGVTVDTARRTYRFARYPPLGFYVSGLLHGRVPRVAIGFVLVVAGALLIAACAQIQFLFPCLSDTSQFDIGAVSYCIPNSRVAEATAAKCAGAALADVCSKRIPVTMQTFSVMLVGAIAGQAGALATALYVLLVCLGAPFGAGQGVTGVGLPMWQFGGIVGSTGGYLVGFIFQTLIMGRAAECGIGRVSLRSALGLIAWMLASEVALYAVGLFWLPFGMAFAKRVSPSAICPAAAGAGACLYNIANWGLVPFIPGEVFKMALVLVTVPAAWSALLRVHAWRTGGEASFVDEDEGVLGDEEVGGEAPRDKTKGGDAGEVVRQPTQLALSPVL